MSHIKSVVEAVESVFSRLGIKEKVIVAADGDGAILTMGDGDYGMDVDYPVEMKTLSEPVVLKGYRVWRIKTSMGSREVQPDSWDETVKVTPSLSVALEHLVLTVLAPEMEDAISTAVERFYETV